MGFQLPARGLNPRLPHRRTDSQPPGRQGGPEGLLGVCAGEREARLEEARPRLMNSGWACWIGAGSFPRRCFKPQRTELRAPPTTPPARFLARGCQKRVLHGDPPQGAAAARPVGAAGEQALTAALGPLVSRGLGGLQEGQLMPGRGRGLQAEPSRLRTSSLWRPPVWSCLPQEQKPTTRRKPGSQLCVWLASRGGNGHGGAHESPKHRRTWPH